MSNVLDFAKNFKDMAELQAYAQAQFKTIVDLTKKLTKLEEDKTHLEKLLRSLPKVEERTGVAQVEPIIQMRDEELICRRELEKLRMKSADGDELTLEETKRVDIYAKLLMELTKKVAGEDKQAAASGISADDLMLTLVTGVKKDA